MTPAEPSAGLAAYRARITREKRDGVLDAATALFLSDGYDRTSLDAVAKRAGVSSATLYKHFPTKADLFGGIMARLWAAAAEDAPAMPAPGNPRAGLTRIGEDYAQVLTTGHTVDLFRVIIAEAPRFPELGQQLYDQGKKPYLDRLEAYLAAETEAGALAVPPDGIALAARQFLGMINDVVFWPRLLIIGLDIPADQQAQVVAGAVATVLARYAASLPAASAT